MGELEKWIKRNWKDFEFRKSKIESGKRLVGKQKDVNHEIVIYHITKRKPTTEDFASFLKDIDARIDKHVWNEESYNTYAEDTNQLVRAYFVLYGDSDKKPFNILLANDKRIALIQWPAVKIKSFSGHAPFMDYLSATRNEE